MSVAAQVEAKIRSLGEDRIFTYRDFQGIGNFQTVALALSRLSQRGKIQRLSKGTYFVPKSSRFGTLNPSDRDVLSTIMEKNGGYFAGPGALNRMGLSTQVPNELVIAGSRSSRKRQIGNLRLKFVRGGSKEATAQDMKLTDLLEALRAVKRVPSRELANVIGKVGSLLNEFSSQELERLADLARSYRPYVRAILGALLEGRNAQIATRLRASLNPISQYKLGLGRDVLPNARAWRIA
jgi:hypothetical protein